MDWIERTLKALAAIVGMLTFLAFWMASEGVSCVGYCYGEDAFRVHYQDAE